MTEPTEPLSAATDDPVGTATGKSPKVTIVTPVYNGGPYIEATIAAIQAQTFGDFEYLVVDDCSKDNTVDLVEAMAATDPRIRLIRAPSNFGGPAGPRNMGAAEARGAWIAFCDADDLWVPDKLEQQLAMADRVDGAFYCVGIQDFPDGITPQVPDPIQGTPPWEQIPLTRMRVKNQVAMSGVMIARETLQSVDPFNTDRAFVAVEDYDMWFRVMEHTGKPAIRIDRPLVLYRRVAQSISAGKWKMVKKALNVQANHFDRIGRSGWFKITRPFRVLRYILVSIWVRRIQGKL